MLVIYLPIECKMKQDQEQSRYSEQWHPELQRKVTVTHLMQTTITTTVVLFCAS